MRARGHSRRIFALAIVVAASSASRARAEPTAAEIAAAKEVFAQAEADERRGDFAAALAKLARVAAVKMTPGVRFHIAHCEENLGQLVLALADYTAAEKEATAENKADVLRSLRTGLTELRARVPQLTVNVPADVAGAEVAVDAKPLPPALWGVPLRLEIGSHTIEAKAPGRVPFALVVPLVERNVHVLDVRLEPAAVTAQPAPVPAAASPGRTPSTAQDPPGTQPDRPSRALPIATSVGAGVLAIGGIISFALAAQQQADARAACATEVSCDRLRGPVRTWDAVALTSWIGAAGLAALSIVLWATPSSRGHDARVVVGTGSAAVVGSF